MTSLPRCCAIRAAIPCIAFVATLACASPARADLITYRFNGNVTGNFITGGGFAGAPIGAPVRLEFTVETLTTPSFSDAARNIWDAVPGTITGLKATVNGLTSFVAPDTPDRARVVNDSLLSGGPDYFDQFWVEMPAIGATPDFSFARVVLSRVEPNPVVASSLAGIDWPTSASEFDLATFTNEQQILIRGDTLSDNLFASIRSVEVIIPAPGAAALAIPGALLLARRRRVLR